MLSQAKTPTVPIIATEKGEAAPPLAVLDRLEQEAWLVAHTAEERPDRGRQVRQQLPGDGDGAVGAGECTEIVAARGHRGPILRARPGYRRRNIRRSRSAFGSGRGEVCQTHS